MSSAGVGVGAESNSAPQSVTSTQSATSAGALEKKADPGGGIVEAPSDKPSPDKAFLEASAKHSTAAEPPPPSSSTAYRIGPQDVLEISVFKVPELSKSVQVADAGSINLPLVGEVPAAGKTAQEIERDLTKKLGDKYLQSPQVTVYVKEYNSQRVTIEGAVKKPGVYPMRGQNSLLQTIALAEGLDASADANVVVFRQKDGRRAAARFDLDSIRAGEADDPPLNAGDVVVVGKSFIKEGWTTLLKAVPLLGAFAWL